MEDYRISSSKLQAKDYNFSENHVNSIGINHYPWDKNGYKPDAECKIVCCADGLKVRMEAFEIEIKATYLQMNDPVYRDSCLEFFVAPFQNHPYYYFNFELNSLGTLLLGYGSKQQGRERIVLKDFKECFQINSEIYKAKGENTGWSVEFVIPFSFLKEYQPESTATIGQQMKGNFYKCGDKTKYPHFGCWSRINLDSPSFHVPQYFGNLFIS